VKKLEDDYRAAAAARDQLRQKLAAAEAQAAKVQQQLQTELEHVRAAAAAEKDSLKSQLKIRTNERDAVTAQYDSFRKNLKELIGNADTAVGALNEAPAKPAADRGARK
jgi:chromosome segregation ATPase